MATKRKRRVRYAVVGLGNIAQVAILPAFEHAKENSELAALVSSDAEKLRILGARYGVESTGSYRDLEWIIAVGSIDAVYVAVPNSFHREMTERAARSGSHVLCEKPLAVTVEDCEAMIRVTREFGVKLMVAYRLHFEEANLRAIERIQAGEIGDPRIFSSIFSHQVRDGDIRTRESLGGGALFDMGIYCVNAARYLFRQEPIEVFAQQVVGSGERFREVDEMTSAILRFPDNRMAQMTASQGAADISEFRVVGTKGDIRLDPAYEYSGELREFVTVGGKTKEKTYSKRDQFAPELVYFSECILQDKEPEPSAEEGLADVRIIQAMIRSAKTGAKVELPRTERSVRPDASLQMKKPPVKKVNAIHAPSPSK
jgi:predicted dehydrogenase